MTNNEIKEYPVVMCIKCEEWFLENVTYIEVNCSCDSDDCKKVHYCYKCAINKIISTQKSRQRCNKQMQYCIHLSGIKELLECNKVIEIHENMIIRELITPYYHPSLAY